MESIVKMFQASTERAVRQTSLPDPTVSGPCQAQATFMCTGEARGEHLNPLAMLPGSTVSADYVPMCQPCKDHLSDRYVSEVHR
jgi:hypothetical protein